MNEEGIPSALYQAPGNRAAQPSNGGWIMIEFTGCTANSHRRRLVE